MTTMLNLLQAALHLQMVAIQNPRLLVPLSATHQTVEVAIRCHPLQIIVAVIPDHLVTTHQTAAIIHDLQARALQTVARQVAVVIQDPRVQVHPTHQVITIIQNHQIKVQRITDTHAHQVLQIIAIPCPAARVVAAILVVAILVVAILAVRAVVVILVAVILVAAAVVAIPPDANCSKSEFLINSSKTRDCQSENFA